MELGGLDLGVFLCAVIEDLNLESVLGRIARQGSPNPHAIIGPGRELEVELKDKISIFLGRIDFPSLAFSDLTNQHSISRLIAIGITHPSL